MNKQMYGLHYQYTHQHGNFIIFSGEKPLGRIDLVPLDEKMLQHYRVPHLLPIEFEEVDMEIKLRFTITENRSLSQRLHAEGLTYTELLRFLYALVSTLDDSKIYMLNEQRYVIEEDMIYVGPECEDIYLIYLPLKNLEKNTLQEDLRMLTRRCFDKVSGSKGNSIVELLNYMKIDTFSVSGLKRLLLHQLDRANSTAFPQKEPFTVTERQDNVHQSKKNEEMNIPKKKFKKESRIPESKDNREQKSERKSKSKLVNLLCGVCITVFLLTWLLFSFYPSEGSFNISNGITLFIGNAVYWAYKQGLFKPSISRNKFFKLETDELDWVSPPKDGLVSLSSEKPQNLNYFSSLSQQTTLLSSEHAVETPKYSNETVLLSDSILTVLEVSKEGIMEQLPIRSKPFLIGRNPSLVQYVEDVEGVSRTHLEINYENKHHYAKDIGSKNGSYLNDERMEPHKPYLLQHGDRIKIVKTEFFYKKSF